LPAKKAGSKGSARPSGEISLAERGSRMSVSLPFRMVRQEIGFLRRHGLGVEIVLYDTNWICSYPSAKVAETARFLREADIEVTVHGPIHDLNPGSLDIVVRDYTRHCYLKTLGICHSLGAKALVLHLGINPLLPESALDGWLESSIHAWEPVVDLAEQMGMGMRLENMFVPSPKFLVALKDSLGSDAVKICFDIGHFNVYSRVPLSRWLDEFGSDIDEVHLNDNNGVEDQHLQLGKGSIDFRTFFEELSAHGIDPRFVIEMTSDKFQGSLKYLARNNLLDPFADT